jgi:hypothetical protein
VERPPPSDALRKFAQRNGTWVGRETMAPSPWAPEGMTATGRRVTREALGGCAIIGDYRQEAGGRVVFEGHSVTIFDSDADEYVMYWFDSLGSPVNVFRGRFEDDVLELWGPGPGGSQMRHRSELAEDGTIGQVSEMTEDGETWTTVMEGEYRRED